MERMGFTCFFLLWNAKFIPISFFFLIINLNLGGFLYTEKIERRSCSFSNLPSSTISFSDWYILIRFFFLIHSLTFNSGLFDILINRKSNCDVILTTLWSVCLDFFYTKFTYLRREKFPANCDSLLFFSTKQ